MPYTNSLIDAAWHTADTYFKHDASGHDIEHTKRVHHAAMKICLEEDGLPQKTELIAILHDVGDHKLDVDSGMEAFSKLTAQFPTITDLLNEVQSECVRISFSKGGKPQTIEGRIVQDADRLDSIGAIGIARCFMFAGDRGHRLTGDGQSAVQHFYDKLLKIKDTLHTRTAIKEAERRHDFLVRFLDELYQDMQL
ncbi:HD domain-containing protein [Alkalicoccus luteus]|uniref:HD domain-containing protein n=1 Tax=Alkalicoccus luteus TaxID=1237094 RepID=UPI0040340A35